MIIEIPQKCPSTTNLYSLPDGEIHCGDAHDFLQSLPAESSDLIFLDPPFNLGKRYGTGAAEEDLLDESRYELFISNVLIEAVRVLNRGGSLYLYHIPRWAVTFGALLGKQLAFRHWIAISMKNGYARGRKLYPAHYALLYFSKGKPSYFRRPKIDVPMCRKCRRPLRDYGGYAKFVKDGINLSDVWDDISPVRHKKYKSRGSNELPSVIPERVLKISGVEGGTFVDPFAGAGSSLIEARAAKMRFVACEKQPEYCNLIYERLSANEEETNA